MHASRRFRRALLAATALLAGGCYLHTNVKPLPTYRSYAPTCPEAVTLFPTAGDVGRAYETLAEISVWAPGDLRVNAEMEEAAQRKRAAALGATGLILGPPIGQFQSFGDKTLAIFVGQDTSRVRSVCAGARG
jgi:hypothetical protein